MHVRLLAAFLFWVVHKEKHWEEPSDPRPLFCVKVCLKNQNVMCM
jgi:hypothetical protein